MNLTSIAFQPRSTSLRCPYCHDGLEGGTHPTATCGSCEVAYHQACAQELGACSTLGCGAPLVEGGVGTVRRQASVCLHCQEHLPEDRARACPDCAGRYHASCARDLGTCGQRRCQGVLATPVVWRHQPPGQGRAALLGWLKVLKLLGFLGLSVAVFRQWSSSPENKLLDLVLLGLLMLTLFVAAYPHATPESEL